MKISEMYKKGKTVVSCEVFPPKNDDDVEKLYSTITDLKEISPDFVSVTYGAGGSTRSKTVAIASHIKNTIGIEVMAHLTCVNATSGEIGGVLEEFQGKGIDNVLALRGDPPQGSENFTKTIGGFGHASELAGFIKKNYDFSIGVAGYPEGHIEAVSLESDVACLKEKMNQGADFILTQLFFDNDCFYAFRDLCIKKGIIIPIIPGILPVLNYTSVKRITSLCGAKIPAKLLNDLEKYKEDKASIEKIGIEYATRQIDELLGNNMDGIHFYTMNKSSEIKQIYHAVSAKVERN